jgi:hypothetical protein
MLAIFVQIFIVLKLAGQAGTGPGLKNRGRQKPG